MFNDSKTTISELKTIVQEFIEERDWDKYHKPKDIALSIAVEVGELLELFQWKSHEEVEKLLKQQSFKAKLEDEIADVLIYILSLGIHTNIDLSKAISKKMEKNKIKYPVDKYKGKYYRSGEKI
ncbi:MAG: nucleotide pyrophosphohydrolase [Candidatus Asgardarchaeia archaeon]